MTSDGSASIQIAVPIIPGAGSLEPTLTLVYGGSASDNVMGSGWAIAGIPKISRGAQTRDVDGKVTGVTLLADDALYIDGERLVPTRAFPAGGQRMLELRKERDDGTIVTATLDGAGFVVTLKLESKAGLTTTFVPGPTIQSGGRVVPIVYLPQRTSDRSGNYIDWEFAVSGLVVDLVRVHYTGLDGPSPLAPFAEISFDYEAVPRPVTRYVLGHPFQRTTRLKQVRSIATSAQLGPTGGALSLGLNYQESDTADGYFLDSVTETGLDGVSLPPVRMKYRATTQSWTQVPALDLPVAIGGSGAGAGYRFATVKSGGVTGPAILVGFEAPGGRVVKAYVSAGGGWREEAAKAPPLLFSDGDGRSLGTVLLDIDGDGLTDMMQSNGLPGSARAFLQTASGWDEKSKFAPTMSLVDATGHTFGVQVGDLDGDGRNDVLIDRTADSAVAFRNTSSGWVASPAHDIAGAAIADSMIADLDCNKQLDWVRQDQSGGQVRLLIRSAGASGWSADKQIWSAAASPGDEALRLFRTRVVGEKCPGLLVAQRLASGEAVVLLLPAAAGWQQAPSAMPANTFWTAQGQKLSPRFADIDGNGGDDILVNEEAAGQSVRLTLMQGRGSPQDPVVWAEGAAELNSPIKLAEAGTPDDHISVIDINQDAIDDLAVLPGGAHPVGQAYLSTGVAWQRAFDFTPTTSFAQKPELQGSVRFIDLNGDGLVDVIFNRGSGAGDKGAFLNTATGWVAAPQWTPPHEMQRRGNATSPVMVVDINSDGFADLVYAYVEGGGAPVLEAYINRAATGGEGWGTPVAQYNPPAPFESTATGDLGWRVADLDANGRLELIQSVADSHGHLTQSIYSNNGSGWAKTHGFEAPLPFAIETQTLGGRNAQTNVQLLDVNADRRPDLVASYIDPNTKQAVAAIYLNLGDRFDTVSSGSPPVRLDGAGSGGPSVAFYDFNHDGYQDLLVTTASSAETYLGTGTSWVQAPEWNLPAAAKSDIFGYDAVRVVDISGDGSPDLIFNATQRDGSTLKGAYLNTGSGWVHAADSFAPPAALVSSDGTDSGVRPIDVNGDNSADLVQSANVGGTAQRAVYINPNKGTGLLSEVVGSGGVTTRYRYAVLSEPAIQKTATYVRATSGAFPIVRAVPMQPLVVDVEVEEEAGRVRGTHYRYGGLLFDIERGMALGFAWTERVEAPSGLRFRTEFNQDYALIGLAKRDEVFAPVAGGADVNVVATSKTWDVVRQPSMTAGSAHNNIIQARLVKEASERHDLDGQLVASDSKTLEYDDWLNITKLTTSDSAGTTVVATNIFGPDDNGRRFGRLTSATTVHSRPGVPTESRSASFTYDANLLLASERLDLSDASLSTGTAYRRDVRGNVIATERSAPGVETRVESQGYDTLGRMIATVENAAHHRGQRGADPQSIGAAFAAPANVTDPNGLRTDISYDGFGRVKTKRGADGVLISYERFIAGDIPAAWLAANGGDASAQTMHCGSGTYAVAAVGGLATPSSAEAVWIAPSSGVRRLESVSVFDRTGQLIRRVSMRFDGSAARLVFTDYVYDVLGRIVDQSSPYFAGTKAPWTRFAYDVLDRKTREVRPDGACYTYDFHGMRSARIDPLGRRNAVIVTASGKAETVLHSNGGETKFTYDVMDRVLSVISPVGVKTEFAYDAAGNRRWSKDPDAGELFFEFDGFGQVRRQKSHADLQWTTVRHDVLGRVTQTWRADQIADWTYDQLGAVGAIASVTSSSQNSTSSRIYKESYSYDSLGRVERTAVNFDGSSDAPKYAGTSTIEYDDEGRVSAVIYPVSGSHTAYRIRRTYDQRTGQLVSVSDNVSKGLLWQLVSADAEGKTTQVRFGNSVTERKTYSTGVGELVASEVRNSSGRLSAATYERDLAGNLTARSDTVAEWSDHFAYDDADHLVRATLGTKTVTATYDLAGRILAKSDVGTYHYGCDDAPANGVCRVTGGAKGPETITYDDRGNVVATRDYTVGYTSYGRVRRIERVTAAGPAPQLYSEFDYGPTGSRIFSRERGCIDSTCFGYRTKETLNLGNTDRITTLRGKSKVVVDRYYVASGDGAFLSVDFIDRTAALGADRTGPSMLFAYMHRDHLGSITMLTAQNGSVLGRFRFDPWGAAAGLHADNDNNIGSEAAWTRGFAGHDHIPQFDLVHMNGRVYDPRLGVFLSVDPITTDPNDSTDLNPYAYALNNPLTNRDISGQGWLDDVGHAIGHAAGQIGDAVGHFAHEVGQFVGEHWKEIAIVVVVVAVTAACVGACAPYVAILAGAAGGATAGALYGGTVQDVFAGAITGAVFGAFGGAIAGSTLGTAAKVAAYGTLSGARAYMGGGDFGRGFAIGVLSAGVDAQGLIKGDEWQDTAARMAVGAVSSGAIAELSGDKFANGAISGAFHELWEDAHRYHWTKTEIVARYAGMYNAREATLIGLGAGAVMAGYTYLTSDTALKFRFEQGVFVMEGAGLEKGTGITLGSTILYTPSGAANDNTYNHEMTHVPQWGAYGTRAFIYEYRRQLDLYGYDDAPFENEGRRAPPR